MYTRDCDATNPWARSRELFPDREGLQRAIGDGVFRDQRSVDRLKRRQTLDAALKRCASGLRKVADSYAPVLPDNERQKRYANLVTDPNIEASRIASLFPSNTPLRFADPDDGFEHGVADSLRRAKAAADRMTDFVKMLKAAEAALPRAKR